MQSAFIPAVPVLPFTSAFSTCNRSCLAAKPNTVAPTTAPLTAAPAITMRCRRDLKKEKSLRNIEFARIHRKKIIRRFNRRAVQEAVQNEDNEFLSSVYGTLRFGANAEEGA